VRGDLMRARHRLGKMLLRHDIRFDDTASRWGERHRAWLAKLDLGQPGAQATPRDASYSARARARAPRASGDGRNLGHVRRDARPLWARRTAGRS